MLFDVYARIVSCVCDASVKLWFMIQFKPQGRQIPLVLCIQEPLKVAVVDQSEFTVSTILPMAEGGY